MIDNHMINTGHRAHGSIDLLFAVPLVLVEKHIFGAYYNEANLFTSVVATDEKFSGHAKVFRCQLQDPTALIILAELEFNSRSVHITGAP
jgi:hypothetical protein